jgi:hypothetical protein
LKQIHVLPEFGTLLQLYKLEWILKLVLPEPKLERGKHVS